MSYTGLWGNYPLNGETIDRIVTARSAGAYALGYVSQGTFYVSYVGRSDDDLAARLKRHIGEYAAFQYAYMPSPSAAFEKECRLYHEFNPPDNKVHPARPEGTNYRCPVLGCSH